MDEEVQGVETEETEAPITEDAPVEASTDQEQSESQTTEDTRDFRKAFEKKNEEAKEFKRLYRESQRTQLPTPTPAAPQDNAQAEALKVLDDLLEAKFAPIRERLEAQNEDQIVSEFSKDPYVKALAPEINAELDNLPKGMANLPLGERLEAARAFAIAKNAGRIAEIHQKIGTETAYKNQALKKGQNNIPTSRQSSGEEQPDILERAKTMSQKEFNENYEAIAEAEKKLYGIA